MSPRKQRLRAATATVVLATFGWTAAGGSAWAEASAAERDPVRAALRLADDPRLPLSAEEREALRRGVGSMAAALPAAPPQPRSPGARPRPRPQPAEPAAAMHQIGEELAMVAAAGDPAAKAEKARQAVQRLEALHRKALRELADTEARLRAAGLPRPVLDRHAAAVATYRSEMEAVLAELGAAGRSEKAIQVNAALAVAAERLLRSTDERPNEAGPLDPSRLPVRVAEPVKRAPAGGSLEKVGAAAPRAVVSKATPPTAADLAENEEVQLTPEVRALATSLGNNPVRIYEWVRNNIEHYPTFGAVQGSQLTLDNKRGNAFDSASLLIALLRAAGTPARYVTGTVQVPVDAVKNWVGGAATSNVAQQLLGQGGVPNVALVSGGVVTHIRLDHVWVEAFVDNIPSRGAVQRAGDTWVPMDPSFKQYQFTPRSNLFAANPISAIMDPTGVVDVDESLGKVSNVRRDVLDQRLTDWAMQSDAYINANGVERSREGLLGRKTIVQQTSSVFPASLPYEVLVRDGAVSTLPASLRHTVTLVGYDSSFARALGDEAFSVRIGLPALNSRRLGLQFDPATQADADVLAAARNGGASSLPVYLVDVVPSVKLDGQVLGAGGPVQMGGSFFLDVVFQGPDGPTTVEYQIVAGDEIVVGVTGNGFAPAVVQKRFQQRGVTEPAEYLHQVGLHYWMETDYLGEIAAQGAGVHQLRLPSVGLFESPLSVAYFFGAPRSGVYQGNVMDVKLSLMGVAGPSPAARVNFMKQAGFQGSYLEGSVFDQLATTNDPTPANHGISSIHLLSAAMAQGIPVYRITSANAAAALPMLQLSPAVEADISRAVSQGKTVLTAERDIDLGPWRGVGYIIHDETTGAGAYLISGGVNGGGILDCLRRLVPSWEAVRNFLFFLIFLAIIIAIIIAALGSSPVWVPAAAAILLFLVLLGGVSPTSPSPPTEA